MKTITSNFQKGPFWGGTPELTTGNCAFCHLNHEKRAIHLDKRNRQILKAGPGPVVYWISATLKSAIDSDCDKTDLMISENGKLGFSGIINTQVFSKGTCVSNLWNANKMTSENR